MKTSPIVLLTDFGVADPYVGQVKGVLLSRCPGVVLIDLSHNVPPGAVLTAAFLLKSSLSCFPSGTVFMAVVDPGVGSARRALALEAGGLRFVGPDNGLLPATLEGFAPIRRARSIENPRFRRSPLSSTFHGRDLFAPAAAALANGAALSRLGPPAPNLVPGRIPSPRKAGKGWIGEVLWVDRFGNLITNLPAGLAAKNSTLRVGKRMLRGTRDHFAQMPSGRPLALGGSFGTLELSVNRGRADRFFRAEIGSPVQIQNPS